jgi:hypothetical protein
MAAGERTQMSFTRLQVAIFVAAALTLPVGARADLIVGILPGANSISFADGGLSNCSAGATTGTDAGFSISTDGAACLPFSGPWAFADNGQWYGLPALGDYSGTSTVTIDLGGSFSAVWGFMNYALSCDGELGACTYFGNDPTITALDKDKNVLETEDIAGVLSGSSSGDIDFLAGDYVGLSQSTADIAYLQFGGDYIAMTNISTSGVPEPSTLALLAMGLSVMAMWGRRARPELRRNVMLFHDR